nr:uncharacterized protein LOC123774729 [Procambarus clarkii]
MDIDQHLMWLISAIKASIDGEVVDDRKLVKNIGDCFLRIKKASPIGNKSKQFDDFRARATLLLLLCCRRIRELSIIKTSKDFQSVVVTLPVLSESAFFSVIRSQKMYRFLAPILSWVSPEVIQEIMKQYFICIDEVTPVTLAITLELLKGLLFSFQHEIAKDNSSHIECLHLLLKFLSTKSISSETPVLVKSSGYYYLYICEFVYLMLTVYAGQCLKEPDVYTSLQVWISLWKNERDLSGTEPCLSFIKETIRSLLSVCQLNCKAISVDIWMTWNDLILPALVTVHGNSSIFTGKVFQKSIQSVICNIAFDILRILDSHPDIPESLNSSEFQSLLNFFKEVASDPDYDPDEALTLKELLQEIELKDDRQPKLLGILMKRDIFASQDVQECVKAYSAEIPCSMRQDILLRFIQHNKAGKHSSADWLNLILDMAAVLPAKQLLSVIEEHLAYGLDERLMAADFSNQLTAVFNQLAGQNSSVPSERHVWLCLQSGKAVVEQAVTLSISLSGLVPVMVQALTTIPQVCQAVLPTGRTLLVSTLLERQQFGLSVKEEQEFANLVKGLLNAGNVLPASEVLEGMIKPFLIVSSDDLSKLTLPLELLKALVDLNPSDIVKPGPSLVSLILTLAHVLHATAYLHSQSASSTLSVRMVTTSVLGAIMDNIPRNSEIYEKDISVLRQLVVKYKLHPRSIIPLAQILEVKECRVSSSDVALYMIMKMELRVRRGEHLKIDSTDKDFEAIFEISKSEWNFALLQLLPHCTDNEWTSAFFLTHRILQSEHTAYPTLQAFQKVLYLVCKQNNLLTLQSVGSSTKDELDKCASSQAASVSIQHCFRCFASAGMVYVEELLRSLPCDKSFQSICSIFKWWCRVVPMYQCDPDLPSLFLVRLCTTVEEMVSSGKVKLPMQKIELSGHYEKNQSNTNGVEESEQQKGHKIDILLKAKHEINGKENTESSESYYDVNETKDKCASLNNYVKLCNGFHEEDPIEPTLAGVKGESENLVFSKDKVEISDLQPGTCKEFVKGSVNEMQENGCLQNIINDKKINISNNDSSSSKNKQMKTGVHISSLDFKAEIEEMIFSLVKYVPVSNLASCIASKLKKLHEL